MSVAHRDTLLSAFEAVLGDTPGLAVVHSSFAALAPSGALDKWDVLYAVDQLVRKGWTLVFPAFTFSFTRTGVYDPDNTPSETGVLADWVQNGFPLSQRTDHPIYSFVVLGSLGDRIAACTSKTTFGDTSPFALFEAHDASVVMLGANWTFCTPFHRYEELAQVPYRLFKDFKGQIIQSGQSAPVTAAMYVRDLDLAAENDWSKLVARLRARGAIRTAALWRAKIEATSMSAIRESAQALLDEDALAFVGNAAQVRNRMDMAHEAALADPLRIALLGSSNLDIAGNAFVEQIGALMPARAYTTYVAPFGQLGQQIMLPGSELSEFAAEVSIFADRIEDLLGVPSLDLVEPDTALDAVENYAGLVHHYAQANGGTIVVHRFALSGRHTVERLGQMRLLVDQANALLAKTLGDIDGIVWIDLASEAASGAGLCDARLWHLGRIPFSQAFTAQIATRWAGIVLAKTGKTARLLVLDLDNTLWGGVLGEDGPEGIQIGGDFPGNAFARFQQTIKGLSDRGIALAVSSKNDEDLALDVLQTHAEMVLRPDDFVTHRINWQPKWQNIRDMAAELDLGLGSVMFIDDNPVEREAVKLNLPMVKVLDLPADPTAYTDTLLGSPFIETLQTGKEDQKRVASYKARRKINLERSASANIEDFLRGLQMQLFVQPLNGDNIARAAQLCQKTNQFNTTTRRYSARDLETMVKQGCDVAVIGLQDKFSARENIALIILRPDAGGGEIDLFLMSCRVLGRTVERAVLDWATTRAFRRGWGTLSGKIIETPRNTPARKVFADNGFDAGAETHQWVRVPAVTAPPDWFEVHDEF